MIGAALAWVRTTDSVLRNFFPRNRKTSLCIQALERGLVLTEFTTVTSIVQLFNGISAVVGLRPPLDASWRPTDPDVLLDRTPNSRTINYQPISNLKTARPARELHRYNGFTVLTRPDSHFQRRDLCLSPTMRGAQRVRNSGPCSLPADPDLSPNDPTMIVDDGGPPYTRSLSSWVRLWRR